MNIINLQEKTTAKEGTVELFWFENKSINLFRTLFHRMHIPLTPFDSGIEGEAQPIETQIEIDWLNLNLRDPLNMDRLILKSTPEDDSEISIYIGSAHNPCDIKKMAISKIGEYVYQIDCELFIEFEYEGVAQNETFKFETQVVLNPEIKEQ